ncbi:MAG: hypothetical protein HZA50_04460 [Planctomycetes bacterium]|nr:hypothetical protein [Planctomycetota bacterium]
MTGQFTIDNIDHLAVYPLDGPAKWRVEFRSSNAGLCHQLYVNGALADWADTPSVRHFDLECDGPAELAVAAVLPEFRMRDFGAFLPPENRRPAWVWRAGVVRHISHRPGDALKVFTDRATGQLDSQPAIVRELWPEWAGRWAWGEDLFGLGGLGWDGYAAPGLGRGAFGAASFGMDADLIDLELALAEQGEHRILLRTVGRDGQFADAPLIQTAADPPPQPPQTVAVTEYDAETSTLIFAIE